MLGDFECTNLVAFFKVSEPWAYGEMVENSLRDRYSSLIASNCPTEPRWHPPLLQQSTASQEARTLWQMLNSISQPTMISVMRCLLPFFRKT